MSSGYIYWFYEKTTAPNLSEFERRFRSIGLRLEGPMRQIRAISPAGEQMIVSREWIAAEVATGRAVSFQWWFNDSEDVYCRFSPGDDKDRQWSAEFGLDGVDNENLDAVTNTIVAYFKEQCAHSAVSAIVIDRTGDLEEIDWRAVVAGRQPLQFVPDLLVLPRIALAASVMPYVVLTECPAYALLTKKDRSTTVLTETA